MECRNTGSQYQILIDNTQWSGQIAAAQEIQLTTHKWEEMALQA